MSSTTSIAVNDIITMNDVVEIFGDLVLIMLLISLVMLVVDDDGEKGDDKDLAEDDDITNDVE